MSPFIAREYLWGMSEIGLWFPSVLQRRIAFPCGQVLSMARGALVRDYGFHFVFFFRSDQGQRRSGEAGAMHISLFEQGQKAGVENIMNFPCGR